MSWILSRKLTETWIGDADFDILRELHIFLFIVGINEQHVVSFLSILAPKSLGLLLLWGNWNIT